MNIGILGGTFDPIHKGHIAIATQALQEFSLDEIWFLPNGNPPHKSQDAIGATVKQRLQMVQDAISAIPCCKMVDYEARRNEVSYSYETIASFRSLYPKHTFYFIVGADSLFSLEKWKRPDLFLKECILIATYRDDKRNKEDIQYKIDELSHKYQATIKLLEMPLIPISSYEIRKYIYDNTQERVASCLHADTLQYIIENNLYKE
jgi:nicotinate (nicotinamide) nucleotide adenylyltransferase